MPGTSSSFLEGGPPPLLPEGQAWVPGEAGGGESTSLLQVYATSVLIIHTSWRMSCFLVKPGAPLRGLGLRPNAPLYPAPLPAPPLPAGAGRGGGGFSRPPSAPGDTSVSFSFHCPRGLRAPPPSGQSCQGTNRPFFKWGKLRTEGPHRVQILLRPHVMIQCGVTGGHLSNSGRGWSDPERSRAQLALECPLLRSTQKQGRRDTWGAQCPTSA